MKLAAGRFDPRRSEPIDGGAGLAVWDPRSRSGLIERDRVGTRPLFFAQSGGALLFASELAHLLALLPRRPAPDETAMAHWLAGTVPNDGRTLYEGVRRLAPGDALALDADGWTYVRRQGFRYREPADVHAGEAAEILRAALAGAVERAIIDAEQPAVLLSGGFDSPAVAATAARPLRAYSAVFPAHAAVDESARIAAVRDRLGITGVEMAFRDGSAITAAIDFIQAAGVPPVSPNLSVWLPLLRRAAADGVDVMLDGEGGDELFGCARYLIADRLAAGRVRAAMALARSLPGLGSTPRTRWVGRALAKYGLRGVLPHRPHARLRGLRGRAAPDWLAVAPRDDPWAWKTVDGPRWWAQLLDLLVAWPDALGANEQLRAEAALAGVEFAHPLRDPELIDAILGLPPELGFDPELDRPLARRALWHDLPPEVVASPAKPVFTPLVEHALGGRDRKPAEQLLADLRPSLARLIRRIPDTALERWRVVTLELWLRDAEDPGALDRVRVSLDAEPDLDFGGLSLDGGRLARNRSGYT